MIAWNPRGTIVALNRMRYLVLIDIQGKVWHLHPDTDKTTIQSFTWHPSGAALTIALSNATIETRSLHNHQLLCMTTKISPWVTPFSLLTPFYVAWNRKGTCLAASLSGYSTLLYRFNPSNRYQILSQS